MVLKVLMIWVFPAAPLRFAAGRYVPGSASLQPPRSKLRYLVNTKILQV